jgi:hypothetical protein
MPIDIPYGPQVIPVLLNGVIKSNPLGPGDALYVQIPNQSDRLVEANWDPHGGTLPTSGTACLVGLDEAGQAWVLMWAGGWS